MNSDHQNIYDESPLRAQDLVTGLESRKLVAVVKEVVEVSRDLKKVKVLDCEGKTVLCLMLGDWARKNFVIKKGSKALIGPAMVKEIGEDERVLFGKSALGVKVYFHFEESGLEISFCVLIQELAHVVVMGYTGASACVAGVVVDRFKGQYQGSIVEEVIIADKKNKIKVKFVTGSVDLPIGELVILFSVKFFNGLHETFGIADSDSEWICPQDSDLNQLNHFNLQHLKDEFHNELCKDSFSLAFQSSPYFCQVLKRIDHFPSFGIYFYVVYDHSNFYYLSTFYKCHVTWLKITKCKIINNYIELDDFSCVSEFPNWLNPVRSIISAHLPRLEIVRQEAARSTQYLNFINC